MRREPMVIEQAFLIALTIGTSVGAYGVGVGRLRLSVERLGAALLRAFQIIGMSGVFFVANLTIGLAGLLIVRSVSGIFVSVYLLDDMTLGALSVLQGVVFECWRQGGRGDAG